MGRDGRDVIRGRWPSSGEDDDAGGENREMQVVDGW